MRLCRRIKNPQVRDEMSKLLLEHGASASDLKSEVDSDSEFDSDDFKAIDG